jgi:hypothetical protein
VVRRREGRVAVSNIAIDGRAPRPKRVGRVRPGGLVALCGCSLGDFLATVPALRGVQEAYPEHRRVLLAPSVVRRLLPLGDLAYEVVPATRTDPIPAALARPDIAIDLRGPGPESQRALLALQPRRLFAFRHKGIPLTTQLPAWEEAEPEHTRWCRMLEALGVPADPTRTALSPPARRCSPIDTGATVVHAFAARPELRWPPERWAAVVCAERAAGRRVVLTGSMSERGTALAVARSAGIAHGEVLAGRMTLDTLAALLAHAGRVFASDVGIARLASALGTPCLILVSPHGPVRCDATAVGGRTSALWEGAGLETGGEEPHAALLGVDVADVLRAVALLGPGAAAPRRVRAAVAHA